MRSFVCGFAPPDGYNGESCARLKQGASSFLQVSHMVAGPHTLGPFSTTFPQVIIKEIDQKWSSWNLSWCPYSMLVLQEVASSILCTTMPAQRKYLQLEKRSNNAEGFFIHYILENSIIKHIHTYQNEQCLTCQSDLEF